MRYKRFQNKITAGRLTLPVTILIAIACWTVASSLLPTLDVQKYNYPIWNKLANDYIPVWANRLISFFLYSIIGYLLIELNNTYAFIRMRASVQTSIYFLLIAICPCIHLLYAGDVATVALLIALSYLFKSYQRARATSYLFHAFTLIGMGSLLFPELTLFVPIFWIGAYSFQSLNPKSFFASLVGWSLPYWFLFGYSYITQQMELFYLPFHKLTTFTPIQFDLAPWEIATLAYLFVLYLVSSIHSLVAGFEDKMRTRSFLHFLIFFTLCVFVYILLQPSLFIQLLPVLLIGVSILAGHLFALTNSFGYNLFFIYSLIGIFTLFGFNVWTLLLIH